MKKVIKWMRQNNEFTFVIILIVLIWQLAPMLFSAIDPQAGEFSIEILYIPFIAGVFFFIGLLFVWLYIKLVWPKGFKLLDNVFQESENLEPWQKLKLITSFFACLLALYAISLLAVTGISAIM